MCVCVYTYIYIHMDIGLSGVPIQVMQGMYLAGTWPFRVTSSRCTSLWPLLLHVQLHCLGFMGLGVGR